MNTVKALRDELFTVFRELKAETITPKIAKEMNNSAGKIISSAKAELEYRAMRKTTPDIAFFEDSRRKRAS